MQRYHPALGGAETHVRSVAEEQARRGHDVTVATSRATGEAAAKRGRGRGAHDASSERVGGVRAAASGASEDPDVPAGTPRIVRFHARHWRGDYLFPPWLPMKGLAGFIEREKPDVLHAHSYRFHTIEAAAKASRAAGIPLVVTAHGFYPPESAAVRLSRAVYDAMRGRRALAQASRCIAVTAHEVEHYAKLGVLRDRVAIVPNGIPESAFEPGHGDAFRKAHGLEGPLVLFLARLAHDKGVRDLARAAKQVPDATFAFCGRDAGEGAALRRLAGPNVRVLGPVDDPRDAYAAADVFCLPSHYEAFGIVLIEAMAQGAPVVSTRVGGIPDVVADAGILVAPQDPDALANAVRSLLRDADARRTLALRGIARAGEFLWGPVVDRVMEVYARAAATPR